MTKLKVDSKGRIALGNFAKGVSSFEIRQSKNSLILSPLTEVPAHEAWLYQNPEAMAGVLRGIEDAKNGRLKKLGRYVTKPTD